MPDRQKLTPHDQQSTDPLPHAPSVYSPTASDERGYWKIRVRQDTADNWGKHDPILASGEFGYVIGTHDRGQMVKIGDGTLRWSQLPWISEKGEVGADGRPIVFKGTATAWVPDTAPTTGDVWALPDPLPVGTPPGFQPGGSAAWTGTDWVPIPAIRGPAGHSITVYGPSPTPPPNAGLFKGDIWLADDPSLFSPSFDPSTIVQQPGPPGPKGDPGYSAFEVWKVAVAKPTAVVAEYLEAIKGATGSIGPKGDAGETFRIEGVVPNVAGLPVNPPRLTVYLVQATGELWIYDPTSAAKDPANSYVNLGKIAGPAGRAAWVSASVDTVAKLPATGADGEMTYVTTTGHIWGWNGTAWVDGGRIGATRISDGTIQGQTLVWDATNAKWVAAVVVRVPAGNAEGEMLSWDNSALAWVSKVVDAFPKTQGDGSPLEQADVVHYDTATSKWQAMNLDDFCKANVELANLGDVTITGGARPNDGEFLRWDDTTSVWTNKQLTTTAPKAQDVLGFNGTKWVPKSNAFVPLFRGTYSVGSKSGSTYTPPNSPKEGDIWVDKNSSPPVFKVYRGGAWVLVNWQTDSLGLLSDLANVNVGASGSPGQGDALIFNQLTEQWESGSVPAHIAEYGNTINYSAGTTVYYKGGLFEARERTTGVSPAFQYGDCWLYHRAQFNGSGDWVGPVSFETVTQVADVTAPPSATHAADDLRPHWTLLWKDDANFSVWSWELSMKGWTPGMALPTAQWHRYETQFTKPNAAKIWRNYSTPPQHVGDCVVWVYDDPKGTTVPHYRDFPWILRPIRSDLVSMHDVQAENPTDQSILIWNTATSYWEAKPNPSYNRAEVDKKIADAMQGLAHGEAIQGFTATVPSNPTTDELYIVAATGAGGAALPPEFVGHANHLTYWDGTKWVFIVPQVGEAHLNEADNSLYTWNGSAWAKIGLAGTPGAPGPAGPAGTSIKAAVMTLADYQVLAIKDPNTIYLLEG